MLIPKHIKFLERSPRHRECYANPCDYSRAGKHVFGLDVGLDYSSGSADTALGW